VIRRVRSWLRVVLPPPWAVAILVVLYGVPEACRVWQMRAYGFADINEHFLRLRTIITGMAAVAYALFRALAFHPAFRNEYCKWLAATPWDHRKPLPLGPIHLVPQDVLVLLLLTAMAYLSPERLYLPSILFLGAYLAALCLSFWTTGLVWTGYATAFGLCLIVRLAADPWAALAVAAIMYPLAYAGLRQSLAQFPWQETPLAVRLERAISLQTDRDQPNLKVMGWPWDRLRPTQPHEAGISYRDGILASLLCGWWLYSVIANISDREAQFEIAAACYTLGLIGAAVVRLAVYSLHYWPPISLWGRIWTFRWIIPGYDRVFLAPLCTAAVGVAAPIALNWLGLPWEISFPVSVSLVLLAALNLGPTLLSWRMTGRHRISSFGATAQEFVKL